MITYSRAVEITKECESFYEKVERVTTPKGNEYTVSIFNYLLATADDFENHKAHELRGLTFVHRPKMDGIDYEPFLMLPKFFNINENKYTLLEDIKDKEIVSISLKEDGSLLQPILMPDGCIVWKTKMSFNNDQTEMATNYYNDPKNKALKEYIENHIEDYVMLFELVSPMNRIVVPYSTTELRLLTMRGRNLGWGYPITTNNVFYDGLGIKTSTQFNIPKKLLKVSKEWYCSFLGQPEDENRKTFNSFQMFMDTIEYELCKSFPTKEEDFLYERNNEDKRGGDGCKLKSKLTQLDLLMISRDYIIDEEGFVITFKDLSKVKLKHTDYIVKHKLVAEILKEDVVISAILDETIDDMMAQLDQNDERRTFVEDIEKKLVPYFDNRIEEALKLRVQFFNMYNKRLMNEDGTFIKDEAGEVKEVIDMPKFVKEKGKDVNFHLVMKTKKMSFNEDFRSEMVKLLKEEIKHNTRKLEMARTFLRNI
jgi:hypothetical protein